jgi:acyl dehydratase
MSVDASAVGHKTEVLHFDYDWKTVVLYALGIGLGPADLDYVYEARGPKVFPTFAVVPAYAALTALLERANADLKNVVHNGQSVRLHAPFPSEGRLSTVGTIEGIYDMKRLAQIVFTTETRHGSTLLAETSWSILVRGDGGFGGPRPPKAETPAVPPGAEPDWVVTLETRPEQALLYRLSGDPNPLHVDPELARDVGFPEGPILHGLCTFGVLARAVVAGQWENDARRLLALHAQCRKPVWPGDSIVTQGFRVDPSRVVVQSFAGGRPDPVVTQAWAETR